MHCVFFRFRSLLYCRVFLFFLLLMQVNYLTRACRNIRAEGKLQDKESPAQAVADPHIKSEASAETFPDAESDDDSDELTPMHMLDLGVVTAMGSSPSTLQKSRQKSILDADVLVRPSARIPILQRAELLLAGTRTRVRVRVCVRVYVSASQILKPLFGLARNRSITNLLMVWTHRGPFPTTWTPRYGIGRRPASSMNILCSLCVRLVI